MRKVTAMMLTIVRLVFTSLFRHSLRTTLTILGVSIDESLLQPSEKTLVEDLIAAAINDARAKADQAANSEMQKVTSGLPLPPGMKLPF